MRSKFERIPGARTAALAAVLGATLLAAAPAQAGESGARIEGVGVPAPRALEQLRRHTLRKLDGGTLSLADLRGEVVVLNFWASWCAPCRRELPKLDALNTEIARQGGRVLAISIDEDAANVERFRRRLKLTLPIVHDGPKGLASELDLEAVPLTLVIGRDGEVAYASHRSDDDALAALAAATRRLIAARPVAARLEDGGRP
jgi:thiol-disulfide isomerase/thioredoxin